MKHVLNPLNKKIWTTRGCRFKAYDRLRFKDSYSTFVINALSAYIAAIGILSLNDNVVKPKSADAVMAALSLLLLTVSFLESSKNYKSRSDAFHRHALDLSNIYNEVQNAINLNIPCTIVDVTRMTNDYQTLINNYPENHISIDYKMFQSDNWRDLYINGNNFSGLKILLVYISAHLWPRIYYFITIKLIYYLAIYVPIILFIYCVYVGIIKFK